MGLSTPFYEKVGFSGGGVKTANYDDYPVLTMSEVPEIKMYIAKTPLRPRESVSLFFLLSPLP
jgi:isoquinoline 1-oxidoreductase beta subunit